MGNGSSKKKYGPIISNEKKDFIFNLLENVAPNFKEITSNMLQTAWHDMLSDGLQRTFLSYLFRKSKSVVMEELETFYYQMTEGGLEERARLIISLLGIDNNIPPINFQTYVSDLLESYMMILNSRCPEAYATWKSGDLTQKADMNAISYFFIKDIKYCDDGMVPVCEVESWLQQSSFLKEVSESVVNAAFGIDVECLKPLLPTASAPSTLLRIPTVLLLSHLTRTDSKSWRLLYSSSLEPHSWHVFQNKLLAEGPSLVLIQDREGPLFGGYASTSWKLTPTFYGDENSFLFRLRPELRICLPTGYNQNFQYINSGASTLPNGLGMGGQLNYFGFFLSSEFGPGSVSKTCTTFRDYLPLASQLEFNFSQLEVWAVGDRDPVDSDARRLGGGLAMSRDPGAVAILELVGKGGHAKAAGELQDS